MKVACSPLLLLISVGLLPAGDVVAQTQPKALPQSTVPVQTTPNQQNRDLDKGLQLEIYQSVEKEVERRFQEADRKLQETRGFLASLAVIAGLVALWMRESVMSKLESDVKKRFNEELVAEYEKSIDELKEKFSDDLESLRSSLDAQIQKDGIVQELSILIPRPDLFFQEQVKPEMQVALRKLVSELEELKANNPNLRLTVEDYIKWGDALYYSAWNSRPEGYGAWYNRNQSSESPEFKQVIEYYEKAITQYKAAISSQPNAYKAYLGMGNALRRSGSYDKAIDQYQIARKDASISHIALVNEGLAYRRWCDSKEEVIDSEKGLKGGIELFIQAAEKVPSYARAYYNQACYQVKLGGDNNVEEAISNLGKAFKLDPARCSEIAETDTDLNSIREHDDFKQLVLKYSANRHNS